MRFIIFAKLSNSLTTGYMFLLCGVEVWTNECICKISVMLGSTIIAALQYNSCSPIYERYAFIFVILPIPICCITTIHTIIIELTNCLYQIYPKKNLPVRLPCVLYV